MLCSQFSKARMVSWSSLPLHISFSLACNLCKHYLLLLLCFDSTDAASELQSFMAWWICHIVFFLWDEIKLLNKSQQRDSFSVLTRPGSLFSRTSWASPALERWGIGRDFWKETEVITTRDRAGKEEDVPVVGNEWKWSRTGEAGILWNGLASWKVSELWVLPSTVETCPRLEPQRSCLPSPGMKSERAFLCVPSEEQLCQVKYWNNFPGQLVGNHGYKSIRELHFNRSL